MMNESENLDPAALQRLQRLGDDAFVCKMIDLFLDFVGKKIVEAQAAETVGNFSGVEKAVHAIKSSAGNVGAHRVQELARQIEELAQHGQAGPAEVFLGELTAAFAAARIELDQHKQSLSGNRPD
jgi:HPt (histidine-containing phosphotransfer) domain-containing protein